MKNKTAYSRIIAGTMTWGSWGKNLSKKEMIDLIHHCIEIEMTTFDHADIYGGYTTENDFGNAFVDSGILRENLQLITKCGIQLVSETRNNTLNHYNYSKAHIIWSAEQSLKNLKTDYLDLFLLHRPSPLMHVDEIAEAITQLQNQGKIKTFGVSNFTPSQIALLETAIPVEGNQIEFSLTHEKAMYDGTLDDAITNKRMAMSWSPLGVFFKEKTKKTQRIHLVLKALEAKYNASADQLLLAWILNHPAQVHPVIGTTTASRSTLAINALKIALELEDWFLLLKAAQGHPVP